MDLQFATGSICLCGPAQVRSVYDFKYSTLNKWLTAYHECLVVCCQEAVSVTSRRIYSAIRFAVLSCLWHMYTIDVGLKGMTCESALITFDYSFDMLLIGLNWFQYHRDCSCVVIPRRRFICQSDFCYHLICHQNDSGCRARGNCKNQVHVYNHRHIKDCRGIESLQERVIFHLIRLRLFQELFIVENGCCFPRMVGISCVCFNL